MDPQGIFWRQGQEMLPGYEGSWDQDPGAPGAKAALLPPAAPWGPLHFLSWPWLPSSTWEQFGSLHFLACGSKMATPGPECTSPQVQKQI